MKTYQLGILCVVMFLSSNLLWAAQESSRPKASSHRYINLQDRAIKAPFSDAVQVGNTVYLAGRIGIDLKTGQPPADIEREIRLILDGIKEILAKTNMTMDDLVYVQVFCPDLSLFEKFNSVYRTYFTGSFPARAFVGAGSLLHGAHFEVTGIAVKK